MDDTLGNVSLAGFPVLAGALSALYSLVGGHGPQKTALVGLAVSVFTLVLWLPMLAVLLLFFCLTGIGCLAG